MKWYLTSLTILGMLLSAASLFAESPSPPPAQCDLRRALAEKIVDDLCSMWSEADIPAKYSFLVWPAYKEISNPANWPRLELIRDVSTVGDLVEVWPSRGALVQAVYRSLPERAVKAYMDLTRMASR